MFSEIKNLASAIHERLDENSKALENFEKRLVEANPGVEVWVDVSVDTKETGYRPFRFGFARVKNRDTNGGWGLAVLFDNPKLRNDTRLVVPMSIFAVSNFERTVAITVFNRLLVKIHKMLKARTEYLCSDEYRQGVAEWQDKKQT